MPIVSIERTVPTFENWKRAFGRDTLKTPAR